MIIYTSRHGDAMENGDPAQTPKHVGEKPAARSKHQPEDRSGRRQVLLDEALCLRSGLLHSSKPADDAEQDTQRTTRDPDQRTLERRRRSCSMFMLESLYSVGRDRSDFDVRETEPRPSVSRGCRGRVGRENILVIEYYQLYACEKLRPLHPSTLISPAGVPPEEAPADSIPATNPSRPRIAAAQLLTRTR